MFSLRHILTETKTLTEEFRPQKTSLSSTNVTFSVFFSKLARNSLTPALGQRTILTVEPWIGWTNI